MLSEKDKKITSSAYNFLNLPNQVAQTTGNTSYVYSAAGLKLKKTYNGIPTDYLDGFQYQNSVLQFFPTSEGYYDFVKKAYIYNYTDHLGNVRVSYTKDKSAGALNIIEESNYYAFGLKHEGYNNIVGNTNYNYKYQGQELQETGFYSFKWRNYMPDVGKFFNIDPLAEKYPYNTPYSIQENKLGLGRELEGLELVPRGSEMFQHTVSQDPLRAGTTVTTVALNIPASQKDYNGNPVFDAPSIGLFTDGYDPNRSAFTTGKGFILAEKPEAPEQQEMVDGTEVTPSEPMKPSGFFDAVKLVADAMVGAIDSYRGVSAAKADLYNTAVKDIGTVTDQASKMGKAGAYVNSALPNAEPNLKAAIANYVFSGQLPKGTMMQNSGIITQGNAIMRANGIAIQSQPKPTPPPTYTPIPKDKL